MYQVSKNALIHSSVYPCIESEKKNESERKGGSGVSDLKLGMKLLISETICDYFEEKKTHDIALSLKRA